MTEAERKLWKYIRKKQIQGKQFLRQRPIGQYIVDFYCPEAKLVIEVDGGQHFTADRHGYDKNREAFFHHLDLSIMRFHNVDVLTNIEGVIDEIERRLKEDLPSPSRGTTGGVL